MNWFDVVLLIVILVSFVSGWRTGLARVVVHLIATVLGLVAGFWCYGLVAQKIAPYVANRLADNIIGFSIIFIGVMLLGSLVGYLIARLFSLIGLGWMDHLLGGVAGLFRGAFIVAAAAAVLIAFNPAPASTFLSESRVLPYATQVSSVLAEMAPKSLRDGFTEQIEKLKQRWAQSPPNKERPV